MTVIDLKLVATILVVLLGTIFLGSKLVVNTKRDLHPIALNAQANVGSTRKEHETAVYRNFTVPPGFPLTTGLGLSMGYKIRNGNFGDIWSSVMDLSTTNYVEVGLQKHSLGKINAIAKRLRGELIDKIGTGRLGIMANTFEFPGFTLAIAGLMSSLNDVVPVFLSSIPRSKQDIDVLAIDSHKTLELMNGSDGWYKLIILCEDRAQKKTQSLPPNVVYWQDLIGEETEDLEYNYTPPSDNSHDQKVTIITSSPWNLATSFSHMALVSSVSAFIKSLPMGHELTGEDHLTVIVDDKTKTTFPTQVWTKLLATLLVGGSASITYAKPNDKLQKVLNSDTTLLQIAENSPLLDDLLQNRKSLLQKIRLAWSLSLLSEGVFTRIGLYNAAFTKLRCAFLINEVNNVEAVTKMDDMTTKLPQGAKEARKTISVNTLRALLGSRIVSELYSPYVIMGPIACTNYYDYRVLPDSVDSKLAFYGPICTSLEAKLIEVESAPQFVSSNRQGMLCVRGFTIGMPIEQQRLEKAMKIVNKFDGGEGWMPVLGVYCLWGKDGCLYEFK